MQTGGDGQTGDVQQRVDEPAGERVRRECRLRLFHVAESEKRGYGGGSRVAAASLSVLRAADAAAAQPCGKVISSRRLTGGTFRRAQNSFFIDNVLSARYLV